MDPQALVRLGKAVKDRRTSLGLSQGAVQAAGGPSVVTMNKVENAKLEVIQALTLNKLDVGLGWTKGTAASILTGSQPPTTATSADTSRPVGLGLDDEAADLRPEQIEAVRTIIRNMKPPPEDA